MSDDIIPVNTPETLGVTPRFVLQHHAISRAAHNLSATAQKLTAMAMALLPADMSSLSISFTFTDFSKALGYEKGGESFKIFKKAIEECMNSHISIEMVSTKTGKKKWINYTWFAFSQLDEETGIATMTFSHLLADALKELKRMYAKINLTDIGKLQSKYAIHLYEMANSYSSLKGKDGNKDESWYFERTIEDLRFILGVPEDAYQETKRFTQKAIEQPIKEINAASIGVEIKTESVKQGRILKKIRFNCKKSTQKVKTKGKGIKKNNEKSLELSDITLKTSDQREEKELEHLKELYQEEFAILYQEAFAKYPPFLSKDSEISKLAAEGAAKTKLKEKYGIVK